MLWESSPIRTLPHNTKMHFVQIDAKPFTGDWFDERKVYFCGFAAVAALVAGIYLMMQRKKEI